MGDSTYTGVHGLMYVDSAPVAYAEFSVKISRGVASHKRGGKHSDIKLAGKLDVTGTINRIKINADFLGKMLNTTSLTGQAKTLHSGLTCGGSNTITAMTTTDADESKIRFTVATANITSAGKAVLRGLDVNGNPLTEQIDIPTLTVGQYVTSQNVFSTLYDVTLFDVDSTGGGTLVVTSVAGAASYTVGTPDYFTLKGELNDGTNHMYISMANCFITEGEFKFSDADEIVEENISFTMKDPDADLSIVNAAV